jgi:hypothetical protein
LNLTALVDVAIGLTVVYLGASLFVTVINEYVAQFLNLRGEQLCESLKQLIDNPEVQQLLARSPALKPFFDDEQRTPSYIDPNVLAHLLVGGLAADSAAGKTVKQVSEAIEKWPDSDLKAQLKALVRSAGETRESLVKAVSEWADRSLTMLGEAYKRNLQKISLGIGVVLAIAFNLDTVALTQHLYRDKEAREAVAALGAQIVEKTSTATFEKCMALAPEARSKDPSCAALTHLVEAVRGRNDSLGKLPLGWSAATPHPPFNVPWTGADGLLFVTQLAGWVLTGLALSLGAPFWFDLLNKFVNVRHGMRKPKVEDGG